MDWREQIRDLKQMFEELWERRPTKGGGALKRPDSLCRCLSQNSSNCCLRSRIFPFNPFWLAGANQKITCWGPWTYFKIVYMFDVDLNIFIFVIFLYRSKLFKCCFLVMNHIKHRSYGYPMHAAATQIAKIEYWNNAQSIPPTHPRAGGTI